MFRGPSVGLRAASGARLARPNRQALLYIRPTVPSLRLNSSAPPPPPNTNKPDGQSGAGPEDGRTYNEKLRDAAKTPTKWYPIPIALGAVVLLAIQFRKEITGGGPGSETLEVTSQGEGGAVVQSKKVDGPWQVRVLGALPLRSLSQLWGYLNGLVLPVWFRPFGFKLYASIFGCNLDEVPEDLTHYDSLGEFFYRELKPGLRPIADAPMVSPADGRVLHYGEIVGERVEQVKGITYSLQALLGQDDRQVGEASEIERTSKGKVQIVDDEHFATINDISYSLDKLMGSGSETREDKVRRRWWKKWKVGGDGWKFWHKYTRKGRAAEEDADEAHMTTMRKEKEKTVDASHKMESADLAHDASVAMSLGTSAVSSVTTDGGADIALVNPQNKLHFMVIYLAPGDYHRFHSPTSWVVERRRHFTGDLFSVSPYIANRMKDLFVLNERVALLGRWKHGFYSMVPVGATNVGSIRINFDENLRTNTRKLTHPSHTFTEAVYTSASTILQGQPLLAGEEMGGFRLGSTIVLVFEAPEGWKFTVEAGDKVRVGQKLGEFVDK